MSDSSKGRETTINIKIAEVTKETDRIVLESPVELSDQTRKTIREEFVA